MSTLGTALVSWDEFLQLPDAPDGSRYELHDDEVVAVLMPPPTALHVYIQQILALWLTEVAEGHGSAMTEFPYRPASNLQFWYADVACLPNEDWQLMRTESYLVYSPPLGIEVLSPSNRPKKIQRQRLASFSGGTLEFWVVDPKRQSIEVSVPGSSSRMYGVQESVPLSVLPGAQFAVSRLFCD